MILTDEYIQIRRTMRGDGMAGIKELLQVEHEATLRAVGNKQYTKCNYCLNYSGGECRSCMIDLTESLLVGKMPT